MHSVALGLRILAWFMALSCLSACNIIMYIANVVIVHVVMTATFETVQTNNKLCKTWQHIICRPSKKQTYWPIAVKSVYIRHTVELTSGVTRVGVSRAATEGVTPIFSLKNWRPF